MIRRRRRCRRGPAEIAGLTDLLVACALRVPRRNHGKDDESHVIVYPALDATKVNAKFGRRGEEAASACGNYRCHVNLIRPSLRCEPWTGSNRSP